MAGLQLPMSLLGKRIGGPLLPGAGHHRGGRCLFHDRPHRRRGFSVLVIALLVGGIGASTQHPDRVGSGCGGLCREGSAAVRLAPTILPATWGRWRFPAATAWLLGVMSWRSALGWIGTLGLMTAVFILVLLPPSASLAPAAQEDDAQQRAAIAQPRQRHGFPILFLIGVLDSGIADVGFLAFLPFCAEGQGRPIHR